MYKTVAMFAISLLLLVTNVANAASPAAPVIPDTKAGRVLSAWLKAFDSGDRQQVQRFLQTYEPQNVKRLDGEMQFQRMTGGFDLRKIEKSAPTELTALVQERVSDTFARLTLRLQKVAPYHVTDLELWVTPRPPEFALPHLAQADLLAQLQSYVDKQAAGDRFAGAVLVAKDGKPVFE